MDFNQKKCPSFQECMTHNHSSGSALKNNKLIELTGKFIKKQSVYIRERHDDSEKKIFSSKRNLNCLTIDTVTAMTSISSIFNFKKKHVKLDQDSQISDFRKNAKLCTEYICDLSKKISKKRVFPNVRPGYLRALLPCKTFEDTSIRK